MSTARDTHGAGALPSRDQQRPRAAAVSLAALMALSASVPAWAQAAPQTAATEGGPGLSVSELDAHVSLVEPLLEAADAGFDALERSLASVVAPDSEQIDEDATIPELESAFEAVPGGTEARVALDFPSVRAAYAHTLPGGGWTALRENFGSTLYASDLGAEEGAPAASLALFAGPEEGSLLTAAPVGDGAVAFSLADPPAALPGPLCEEAAAQGFSAGVLWDVPAQGAVFSAAAEARPVSVSATLERVDGSASVRPGDEVTFRAALASFFDGSGLGRSLTTSLADASVRLAINGEPVPAGSLAPTDAPGVFEVSHRVSEKDVAAGSVQATLDARATYQGALAQPGGAPVTSTATVACSLTATAPLSSRHGVTYRYHWDAAGEDAPVPSVAAPRDLTARWEGDEVPVTQPDVRTVALREGTWTFDGWSLGGEPVGDAVTMGGEGLVFVGSWSFEAAPRFSVTYAFSGDAPAVPAPEAVVAYAGDAVPLPELAPVAETRPNEQGVLKDGAWHFQGWAADGAEPAATVSADVALQGSWVWTVPARPAEALVTLAGYQGVYDGQDHGVIVDGLVPGDQVLYRSVRDASGPIPARPRTSSDAPLRCDAGATSVVATVSNQGFADDATASARLEVQPRPVRITVDDATWVQGQPEPVYTGSVEMAAWGSSDQRGLLDRTHLGRVSYRRVPGTERPGVHEGAIQARHVENPNYEVEVVPGTLIVEAEA